MKRLLRTLTLAALVTLLLSVGAHAAENGKLKVGIKYGEDALFSANLYNYDGFGRGYAMGYYDAAREFVPLGAVTAEQGVSMSISGNLYISGGVYYQTAPSSYTGVLGGWHLQLADGLATYEEAAALAEAQENGFVAYLGDGFAVRTGGYASEAEAESARDALPDASVVAPSRTGVVVSVTGTERILFAFDCGGLRSLAMLPLPIAEEKTVTWFKGFRYNGGFEYQRVTGGNINVINVVDIEDYVKAVIPWEIGSETPLEAMKAQAVSARTYAAHQSRHRSQGFDVCTSTDCQVYQGVAKSNAMTDRAVDETAGEYLYYNGQPVLSAVYYSSNGGASEDCKNVWGGDVPYLLGKEDPFEASVADRIPAYQWTVSYTAKELTDRLYDRGYELGDVTDVYVSQRTANGNVYELTVVGTQETRTFLRDACRTVLGLGSLRYTIGGADDKTYYINGTEDSASGIRGVYTISGSGAVARHDTRPEETYVITASGVAPLREPSESAAQQGVYVFSGTGHGHNVGLSQWGAIAMAEQGYSYRDILQFYYTGVSIG